MTDETQPVPRITRIEVTGLFGLYDHVINLNLEDRVTILHGPNGVGKTVLLKMIHDLLSVDLTAIARVPFDNFTLWSTNQQIKIETAIFKPGASKRRARKFLKVTLTANGNTMTFERAYERKKLSRPQPDEFMAMMRQLVTSQQPHMRPPRDIGDTYTKLYSASSWTATEPDDESGDSEEFEAFAASMNEFSTYFIAAQRLSSSSQAQDDALFTAPNPTIWECAFDLREKISRALTQHSNISQDLDRTFPTRLLQSGTRATTTPEQLKSRMQALESARQELQSNGLLNETSTPPFDTTKIDAVSNSDANVISLYIEDSQRKLAAFSALAPRAALLTRVANNRLINKTLHLSHEKGLIVRGHDGADIELITLSSGEQQQLILLYKLLFDVSPGTLVLLDEPELSLHILWQKRFLPDLLEIVKVADIDALIATHSPFIVGDRSDLMIAIDAEIDHDEPRAS